MRTKKKIHPSKRRQQKRERRKSFLILFLLLTLFVLFVSQCVYEEEKHYPKPHFSVVEYYSSQYNVDSHLVYAVMKQESNFKPEVVSNKGAVGLMQLMPDTASWAANKMDLDYEEEKLTDAKYNIRIGVWYLSYLSEMFDGDIPKILAAYNGGDGNVRKWMEQGIWDGTLENAETIPFEETANYVIKVEGNYSKYNEIYE